MIRVLILASSPLAQAGLAALVRANPAFEVVQGESYSAGRAEHLAAETRAEVVLGEIESREDEIASVLLDEAAAGTPVILVVRGATAEWASSLQQGVRAVLPRDATAAQISAAIEAAAAGLGVFDPADAEAFFGAQKVQGSAELLVEPLTAREIEVLRLLADGLGNKEIAARLSISEHTAKFHVASIMGKLGAGSRTEAVTLGIRRGIVLI